MKKRLNKKGFTLIELIVVIAILAILAAILIPSLTGYIQKANDARDEASARAAYSSAMLISATWDTDVDGAITAAGVAAKVAADMGGIAAADLTITLDGNGFVATVTYEGFTFPKP